MIFDGFSYKKSIKFFFFDFRQRIIFSTFKNTTFHRSQKIFWILNPAKLFSLSLTHLLRPTSASKFRLPLSFFSALLKFKLPASTKLRPPFATKFRPYTFNIFSTFSNFSKSSKFSNFSRFSYFCNFSNFRNSSNLTLSAIYAISTFLSVSANSAVSPISGISAPSSSSSI